MKNYLPQIWENSQKRILSTVSKLTPENLRLKLSPETASLGFLMLHIGESQMWLAQLFFNVAPDFKPSFSFSAGDDGREVSLDAIRNSIEESARIIKEVTETLPGEKWEEVLDTRFGKMNHVDALAFIMNHSTYHNGQAMLTLKRGVSR